MERHNAIRAFPHVPEENTTVPPIEESLDFRQQPGDINP